jgi:ribonuclease E
VTVAAVNYDDEGNFVSDETLFEATHHRPEALLRFAPNEVDDALRTVAGVEPIAAGHVLAGLPTMPDPAEAEVPATYAEAQEVIQTAVTAKRKRRTKAEIAADEAAARLAAVQSAEVPVAEVEQVAPAEPASPAAPVTAPEPVPAEAPPATPWNPFEQR